MRGISSREEWDSAGIFEAIQDCTPQEVECARQRVKGWMSEKLICLLCAASLGMILLSFAAGYLLGIKAGG